MAGAGWACCCSALFVLAWASPGCSLGKAGSTASSAARLPGGSAISSAHKVLRAAAAAKNDGRLALGSSRANDAAATSRPPWEQALWALAKAAADVEGSSTEASLGDLCAQALAACGEARRWEEAMGLLTAAPRYTVALTAQMCTSAIGSFARAEEWRCLWGRALELLFVEMPRRRLNPDAATFGAVVETFPRKWWRPAIQLLETLRAGGAEPAAVCCDAIFTVCKRSSRWDRVLQLLAEVQRQGIRLTATTYSAAVFACGRANPWVRGWTQALMLLPDVRRRGLLQTAAAYNAAIISCPGHLWHFAFALLAEMLGCQIVPSFSEYTSVITVCHRGRQWRPVLHLLADMLERRIQRNVQLYNAVIFALSRGHVWWLAWKMFASMRLSGQTTPNVVTYNVMINTCVDAGNWCQALEFWFDMKQRQLTPDWDTYTALLRVSEKCERWEWTRQLMDTLDKFNAPKNVEMYTAAINACRLCTSPRSTSTSTPAQSRVLQIHSQPPCRPLCP